MKQESKKRLIAIVVFGVAFCAMLGAVLTMNRGDSDIKPVEAVEDQIEAPVDSLIEETGDDVIAEPVEETPAVEVSAVEVPALETPAPIVESEETDVLQDNDKTKKTSEDKPKTKEEATPPTEAPKVKDETETTNPKKKPEYKEEDVKPNESKKQPKSGDVRSDGAIYVPGFGWVEDSGEPNKQEYADFELTGNLVGEMD